MAATKTQDKPVAKKMYQVFEPGVKMPTNAQFSSFSEDDQTVLRKLIEEPAEYVDHELFHKNGVEVVLFGKVSHLAPGSTYFEEVEPIDPSAGNTKESTLTTAHEILLFQRFNYARFRVAMILLKYEGRRPTVDDLRLMLAWQNRVLMARGVLAQSNLPLVLAMAKRTRLNGLDFNDLISEGNFALLRSIDKFDCSRGFKFSTYACRAILKSFSRVAMRTSRYRGRFPTEFDPDLEKSDFVERKRDNVEEEYMEEIRDILGRNRAELNDMEQVVIRERFALDAVSSDVKPKTLEQVGEMIGVTKERVRQIQNKALKKIRGILEDNMAA